MTNRAISYWQDTNSFTSTFTNGRESTTGVTGTAYDPAGNQINTGTRSSMGQTRTYDAANRNTVFTSQYKIRTGLYTYSTKTKYALQDFDGNGRNTKLREKIDFTIDPTRTKYQIWSTALGGYLTEANYTGAKETTKVYAGGAIVAEQIGIYTSPVVAWIHADPVTGSSVWVNKDGTLWYRTEKEPLGQEVNPYGGDEDFPEPHEQFGGILNDAYDPQWQCASERAMGRPEHELPTRCQIAGMQSGIEFYITYEEKGNPDKVAESAARHEQGHPQPSAADEVLAYSKRATYKDSTSGGGSDVCPPGQVQIGTTKEGKPICSDKPITATVTVQNVDPPNFAGGLLGAFLQAGSLINLFGRNVKMIGFTKEQEDRITYSIFFYDAL